MGEHGGDHPSEGEGGDDANGGDDVETGHEPFEGRPLSTTRATCMTQCVGRADPTKDHGNESKAEQTDPGGHTSAFEYVFRGPVWHGCHVHGEANCMTAAINAISP